MFDFFRPLPFCCFWPCGHNGCLFLNFFQCPCKFGPFLALSKKNMSIALLGGMLDFFKVCKLLTLEIAENFELSI